MRLQLSASELARRGASGRQQRLLGDHLVDQAHAPGGARADVATGEDHVQGLAQADQAREPGHAAAAGNRPSITWGSASTVFGESLHTRYVQASASSSPAPRQAPSIAATIGTRAPAMRASTS